MPALAASVLVFITFMVHSMLLGASAFPAGRVVSGRYLVEEHGKIIELTASQYWLSYLHGIALIVTVAVLAVLVVRFYCTGDLKDTCRDD